MLNIIPEDNLRNYECQEELCVIRRFVPMNMTVEPAWIVRKVLEKNGNFICQNRPE